MTKTKLQVALAEATRDQQKTVGALLNALGAIAYKAVKKDGKFVLPGFGKLVKQKRAARMAFNPQTRQKVKVAAKTVIKFRVAKGAKDAILGAKAPSDAGQTGKQALPPAARLQGKAGAARPSINGKASVHRAPTKKVARPEKAHDVVRATRPVRTGLRRPL